MRKQTWRCWQSFLLALIATIFLLSVSSSTFAQAGVGKKYGARDPRTCPNAKQPLKGAPSPAQAAQYVICGIEHEVANQLYLVDDVKVEVGGPRPYNPVDDRNVGNLDPTQPLYAIHASFRKYQCNPVSDYMQNAGKNCAVYEAQRVNGYCGKDTFGDWGCGVHYGGEMVSDGVPPPGGAVPDDKPAVKKIAQNAQPKKDGQQPENKNQQPPDEKKDAAADGGENGAPKPDLSAMDKWYEITKFEYGDPATDASIHIWFKPKVGHYDRSGIKFEARYYDKDGVLVGSYPLLFGSEGYYTEPGEVGKVNVRTPSETEMERVVSVKIVRKKE